MKFSKTDCLQMGSELFNREWLDFSPEDLTYLFDRLDTPISSIIKKILTGGSASASKEYALTKYIEYRPQYLTLIPKNLQNYTMVLAGSRQARSYTGSGDFLDFLNLNLVNKQVKQNLIEQGLLNVFLDEPMAYRDQEYILSLFKSLKEGFIYQCSKTREYDNLLKQVDYSVFSDIQLSDLIKASHEFFNYIPMHLIPEEAVIDHVDRYKTSFYIKDKVSSKIYQQALKIELVHKNFSTDPIDLVNLIVKLKRPETVRLIKNYLKTFSPDEVVIHASTENQLKALAEIYGINASVKFNDLSQTSKRYLLENDIGL